MISYAQNFEDVLLNRVFPKSNGFYVDVGAALPTLDSVTKYFYDKGWRGINIEPQPHVFEILNRKRPEDINLECAIGTKKGKSKLTVFENAWGWATLNEKYSQAQQFQSKKIDVEVRTLESVLNQYAVGKEIDFIKIDVEGNEFDVVKSFNLRKWKPKVLILEVITQADSERLNMGWRTWLWINGYRYALFDGLNMYYVRADLSEIKEKLNAPANCLDGYFLASYLAQFPDELLKEKIENRRKSGKNTTEFEKFLENKNDYLSEGKQV